MDPAKLGLLGNIRRTPSRCPDQYPEGVCSGCYGGTAKTYSEFAVSTAPDGSLTFGNENRRWPRCYNCNYFDGLDGVLPISYSLQDRLESAIARGKNETTYEWLNRPLASVPPRLPPASPRLHRDPLGPRRPDHRGPIQP